jgi:hypothetical protein
MFDSNVFSENHGELPRAPAGPVPVVSTWQWQLRKQAANPRFVGLASEMT